MIVLRKMLISILLCPAGFLVCLVGVLIPWHARNAYLKVIGAFFDVVLRLDFFVSFFMDVGFVSKQPLKSK